jgi:hypothetical protein
MGQRDAEIVCSGSSDPTSASATATGCLARPLDRRGLLRLGTAWAATSLSRSVLNHRYLAAFSGWISQGSRPESAQPRDGSWTWTNLAPARNPIGRSYSGIHYGDGKLLYFGGGHFSHQGNAVELYDPIANRWVQQYPDEPGDSGVPGTPLFTPTGKPYTTHTYQQISWSPRRQAFVAWIRYSGLWSYVPPDHWTLLRVPSIPQGGDIHTHHLFRHDPDVAGLLCAVTGGANRGLWLFRDDNTFHRVGDMPVNDWDVAYSCYIATWRAHLVRCWKRWWRLEGMKGIWTELRGGPATYNFAYDTRRDIVVAAVTGDDWHRLPVGTSIELVRLDPSVLTWSPLAVGGSGPVVVASGSASAPVFHYSPPTDSCVFLEAQPGGGGVGGASRTFALRPNVSGREP